MNTKYTNVTRVTSLIKSPNIESNMAISKLPLPPGSPLKGKDLDDVNGDLTDPPNLIRSKNNETAYTIDLIERNSLTC